MRPDQLDSEELADALAALAHPARLDILRELRSPKALHEIRVRRGEGPDDAGHLLSRQAVRQHLDRLLEAGVVSGEAGTGDRARYLLDQRRLFALGERFRALASLETADEVPMMTQPSPAREAPRPVLAPRLVIVHGLREGRVFPLDAPEKRAHAWTIGRRRDAGIPLDYDPFVSGENAVVRRSAEGVFTLQNVPGSLNGTTLNFERLPDEHAPRPLRHGDLVGAGRTTLVFWTS